MTGYTKGTALRGTLAMKCVLGFAVLVLTVVVGAGAAPSRLTLHPAPLLRKGVGDIWSNCTNASDMGAIDKVSISPDPPVIGKDFTVTADFTLKEDVTSGNIAINLIYEKIPLVNMTVDLCDNIKMASLDCPLKKGVQTAKITQNIPYVVPSGDYSGKATLSDQNGKEIICVDLKFTLSSTP